MSSKMIEALLKSRKAMDEMSNSIFQGRIEDSLIDAMGEAQKAISLALTLRNCDVGTAEEQGKRCLAQFEQWKRKSEGKQVIVGIMEWAQMPYESEVKNEQ